jgi:hypothetical protein
MLPNGYSWGFIVLGRGLYEVAELAAVFRRQEIRGEFINTNWEL